MNKTLRYALWAVLFVTLNPASSRADFFEGLQPKLIQAKDEKAVPYKKEGANPKFTAIYYSAHWCPPCRLFTPKLVEWYNEFQPKHKDFQLIFASSDKDEKAMLEYMSETKMPWPAIRFSQKKAIGVEKFAADGIPYLVLIDEKGKDLTGKAGNEWQAPAEVLKQIEEIVGGKK
jgi:nucleoredoxin